MDTFNLCHRDVVTIRPYEELTAAAKLMRERHIGYLVVVEPEIAEGSFKPVGVLTDRDIVLTVVAREIDPRTLRIEDVMTRAPVVAAATDSLGKTLDSMRRIGVRRLPVVGRRGELVGVISLDDVVDALAGELAGVAESIRNEQRFEQALRP